MAYTYLDILLLEAEGLLSRIRNSPVPTAELGQRLQAVSEEIRFVLEDINRA